MHDIKTLEIYPNGNRETILDDEAKEYISQQVKASPITNIRFVESAHTADLEREYFRRLSVVCGGVVAGLSFFLPVVRVQPLLRRAGAAGILGSLAGNWTKKHGQDLWWGRTNYAFKKMVMTSNRHPHIPQY